MNYFLNLYSPETYEAFSKARPPFSGFRIGQKAAAEKIKPGDRLLCYLTKVSRWVGILEVTDEPYVDKTPFYYETDDPFILRFKIKVIVWLDKEQSIPIHEDILWNNLSFTKGQNKNSSAWTGLIRGSLRPINKIDAETIAKALEHQALAPKSYPVDAKEYDKHIEHRVRTESKTISVTVPDAGSDKVDIKATEKETRDSTKYQAKLAEAGTKMGFKVWVPRNDRAAVLKELRDVSLLEALPLNYDDTTLKTIENIDVIWLYGRSIVRAFEVEHTTSIYSGILRMADLLALQPNMDIRLHLVAPSSRKDKVFSEIKRPVFALLEKGPLNEYCTYLSYESIDELMGLQHLAHVSDTILDEYEELAE